MNLLRILIHYSKHSKSAQNVVIHYIFSSESLRVVNSLTDSKFTTRTVFSMSGPLGFANNSDPKLHNPKVCVGMGSQHPSPTVRKTLCTFDPRMWPEIMTSRDAESRVHA